MPRMGVVLGLAAVVVACIGFNIQRYPAVLEMLRNQAPPASVVATIASRPAPLEVAPARPKVTADIPAAKIDIPAAKDTPPSPAAPASAGRQKLPPPIPLASQADSRKAAASSPEKEKKPSPSVAAKPADKNKTRPATDKTGDKLAEKKERKKPADKPPALARQQESKGDKGATKGRATVASVATSAPVKEAPPSAAPQAGSAKELVAINPLPSQPRTLVAVPPPPPATGNRGLVRRLPPIASPALAVASGTDRMFYPSTGF